MNHPPGDSPPRPDDHQPGDTLRDGRYAVTGKLGEGGQATTFEAIDKREGRRVTVKRFRVRGASSWKEVELAEREAKVLAQLAHPRLPVYVDHFEEAGCLYLVTERIDGDSVASLREKGACSEAEVMRFLADAAEILDYLHGRSPPIVHRDIKPSNVLRRPDGSFAIIDFGAVRDRLGSGGSTVVGTFGYMAPEQFQGRAMPVSDVYATGATAIAMLTGQEPEALPHKGLAIDVASALGPRASPALVRALAAMVEPDPDRRAPRLTTLLGELRMALREAESGSEKKRGGEKKSEAREPRPKDDAKAKDERESKANERDPQAAKQAAEEEMGRVVEEAGDQVMRVVAEVGDQVRRVVEEVSHQRGRDGLEREARRVADLAREMKRAGKQAKREARRGREERDREQEHAREENRDHEARPASASPAIDRRPRGAPLGGPVLAVVLLGLTIGQLAVVLALRVIAPAVLYLVSFMFFGSIPGRAMRTAGRHVAAAGTRAVAAIGRAKVVVSGRARIEPPAGAASTTGSASETERRDASGRSRFATEGATDEVGESASDHDDDALSDDQRIEEEAAAEAEAAAHGGKRAR